MNCKSKNKMIIDKIIIKILLYMITEPQNKNVQ